MPRERPRPGPFEPTSLARSLDRYLIVGLIFMALLIAGFVAYRAREPGLRATATQSQRVSYISLGRGLFSTNCAECHGENGGGGGGAPTLASKEFLSSTADAQSEALIAAGISGTDMSAWGLDYGGTLTAEQVRQVVEYLRSLEAKAPSIPDWRTGETADG